MRRRIADSLELICQRSPERGRLSAAAPVDQRAVEIARPALLQLARALRSRVGVAPRGVALAQILVTDPYSALYRPAYRDELYEVARETLFALGPHKAGTLTQTAAARTAGFFAAIVAWAQKLAMARVAELHRPCGAERFAAARPELPRCGPQAGRLGSAGASGSAGALGGGPASLRGARRSRSRRGRARRPGGARARSARRRIRRHRHESALHRSGPLHLLPRDVAPHRRERLRRRLTDLLGADDRGVDQVRGLHHARAQPRRRRDHEPHGAAPAQRDDQTSRAGGARDLRRRAVPRRRHDHAGDLGPRLRPGPEGGDARALAPGRANRPRRPHRAVRHAALRLGRDRPAVRSRDDRLVPRDRRGRAEPGRQGPGRAAGALAELGDPLPRQPRRRRLSHPRRRRARRDRRRGALRRPRALRRRRRSASAGSSSRFPR